MRFALALTLALTGVVSAAIAEEIRVPANGEALSEALETAQAGDVLRLSQGTYLGPFTVATSLTIEGNDSLLDGQENGSTITVTAPDVTLRGLKIIGSGSAGNGLDAGITLSKKAHNAVVENNHVVGNLVGIDVHGAHDALIQNNVIEGRQSRRMNDRGNGIYVWNAPGTKVIGNDVRWGRDGVFVNTSKNNIFEGNRFRDLRFAVHYMYANNSRVSGNISVGNHIGFAVMYSDNVEISGNMSVGDRDHGIMMNYTNKSLVSGNHIQEVGDKCAFIYNAHKNTFTENRFENCGIGIHFTAGSEKNEIYGNGFLGNRSQVKYVGSKWVEWSRDGRGNYWSDGSSFDLDGNGIADAAYRPNDVMDHVLWSQPAAKTLLGSPAIQLIRWSQAAFPALLPGGVIDRSPLMAPPSPELPLWRAIN